MEKTFTKIKHTMNYILSRLAALLLIIMSFLVIYQVFTRYILNDPADFTEEIVRYSLIWTGFIGAAYAFSTRQHMALLFVRDKFNTKNRKILMIATDLLVLLFALFVMTIGGFKLAYSARMEFSALLGISRSIVYCMAPISGVFIIIAQLINIWQDATGIEIEDKEEI